MGMHLILKIYPPGKLGTGKRNWLLPSEIYQIKYSHLNVFKSLYFPLNEIKQNETNLILYQQLFVHVNSIINFQES